MKLTRQAAKYEALDEVELEVHCHLSSPLFDYELDQPMGKDLLRKGGT